MTKNAERVAALVEPWSGTVWDADSVATWVSAMAMLLDPAVVYEDATMFDEAFHGVEGVAEAYRRWLDAFDGTRVDLLDVASKADIVVTAHRFRATARHTGIEFGGEFAYVWTFRDDRIVHYRSTPDLTGALRAVELEG